MSPIAITVILYSLTAALGIAFGLAIGVRLTYRNEVLPRDSNPEKFYEVRYASNFVPYIALKTTTNPQRREK